jgi:hypothetical protein
MSDIPISGLATLTTYSTADLIEVLDVSDTTFASTGTNKKIAVQNLLGMALGSPVSVASGGTGLGTLTAHGVMLGEGTSNPGFATVGTAGNILTDNGSGADPTFQQPVTKTIITASMASAYTLTTSFANVTGLSLSLPSAGTYLLFSVLRGAIVGTATSVGGFVWIGTQFYDSGLAAAIPNSAAFLLGVTFQTTASSVNSQGTAGVGPILYTISAPTTVVVQGKYTNGSSVPLSIITIAADSSGWSSFSALRIY